MTSMILDMILNMDYRTALCIVSLIVLYILETILKIVEDESFEKMYKRDMKAILRAQRKQEETRSER